MGSVEQRARDWIVESAGPLKLDRITPEEAWRIAYEAGFAAALREQPEIPPRINIKCEAVFDGGIGATTSLNVLRVEREDDDSFTAVTDHWPEARGVVDDVTRDAARWRKLIANTKTDHIWHFVLSEEHKEGHDHFLDVIDALPLTAAQQP